MTIKWISPKEHLPPQGKKILAFYEGDCWVVQRFGKYWLPIPFTDSKFSRYDEPELWANIEMPGDYTGRIHLSIENELLTIDQVQEKYPDHYKDFIEMMSKKALTSDNGK